MYTKVHFPDQAAVVSSNKCLHSQKKLICNWKGDFSTGGMMAWLQVLLENGFVVFRQTIPSHFIKLNLISVQFRFSTNLFTRAIDAKTSPNLKSKPKKVKEQNRGGIKERNDTFGKLVSLICPNQDPGSISSSSFWGSGLPPPAPTNVSLEMIT